VTFGKDPTGLPTTKAFTERYKTKYGEPGPYSVYAYDAANIILSSIKARVRRDGMKIAEHILKGTFPGAFGDITFDRNGDVTKAPYVVWVVRNGRFEETK